MAFVLLTHLKGLREARHLTQHELAIIAGVSLRTIQRAEKGRGVSLETARSLAAAFNLPSIESLHLRTEHLHDTKAGSHTHLALQQNTFKHNTLSLLGSVSLSILVFGLCVFALYGNSLTADFMLMVNQADAEYAGEIMDALTLLGTSIATIMALCFALASLITLRNKRSDGKSFSDQHAAN